MVCVCVCGGGGALCPRASCAPRCPVWGRHSLGGCRGVFGLGRRNGSLGQRGRRGRLHARREGGGVSKLPRGVVRPAPCGPAPSRPPCKAGAAHPGVDDALALDLRPGGVYHRTRRQHDCQVDGAGRAEERGPREQAPAAGVIKAVDPDLRAQPVQGNDGGLQLGDGFRIVAPAGCEQAVGGSGRRGSAVQAARRWHAYSPGGSGRCRVWAADSHTGNVK